MKKRLTFLLGFFLFFIVPQLEALHRDYPSYTDTYKDPWLEEELFPFCSFCGADNFDTDSSEICLQQIEEAQATILKKSTKIAALREKLVADTIKQGKILVKNPNAKYHIMQKKHAWEKVVELTGNVEEDFKKVAVLLEENHITNKSFLIGSPELYPLDSPKIQKVKYEKIINNHKIRAEFETCIETGEIFLQDAWVSTR